MDSQETNPLSTKVIKEMGASIRRQAHARWDDVRTAERNEGGRHVWRFRKGPDESERFLHVPRKSMTKGDNPGAALLKQLSNANWMDRLQEGPETSFVLSPAGRLQPWPRS